MELMIVAVARVNIMAKRMDLSIKIFQRDFILEQVTTPKRAMDNLHLFLALSFLSKLGGEGKRVWLHSPFKMLLHPQKLQ